MLEKPVIVNNSPLVHLLTLNRLSLLRALYTEVWIPQEVKDEFLATDPEVREDALKNAPWIRPFPRQAEETSDATQRGLSIRPKFSGEDAVRALAQKLNARLIIIDDLKARRRAKHLKLPFKGVLGVLVDAKRAGFIDAIKPLISVLVENGARLGQKVIDKALRAAGEA